MTDQADHGYGKTTTLSVGGWKPSPYDVRWAEEMVRVLRDKGLWQLPESGNVYQIDHKAKTFDLVTGELDDTFIKNFICFNRVGYLVRDCRGPNPIEPQLKGKVLIVPDGAIPTSDNSIALDYGSED